MRKNLLRMCFMAVAIITTISCNGQSERQYKEWEGEFSWQNSVPGVYKSYTFEIIPGKGNVTGKMIIEAGGAGYAEYDEFVLSGELKANTIIVQQTEGVRNGWHKMDMSLDKDIIPKEDLKTYKITKRNEKYFCDKIEWYHNGETEEEAECELLFNPYDVSAKKRVETIYNEMISLYKQSDDGFADLSRFNTKEYLSEDYMTQWQKAEEKFAADGNEVGYLDYDHWGSMQDPGSGMVDVSISSIKMISETKAEIKVYLEFGCEENNVIYTERSQELTLVVVKERGGWYVDNFIIDELNERASMEKFLKE